MLKNSEMKVAYLILTGEINQAFLVSTKLYSPKNKSRGVKAAKRMGFKNAYASKMMVSKDLILK